eukprot:3063654-Rhodomonas_salina.8
MADLTAAQRVEEVPCPYFSTHLLCDVRYLHRARTPYAMSGSGIAHAVLSYRSATHCRREGGVSRSAPRCSYARATRCPVLTSGMVLPGPGEYNVEGITSKGADATLRLGYEGPGKVRYAPMAWIRGVRY